MEKNYTETLNKANTYFKNIIKEREKYMQQINLDLPKRIEIQTLPLSTSNNNSKIIKVIEKFNKLDSKEHYEPEKLTTIKPKSCKKKSSHHVRSSQVKIESFDLLKNMNNGTELRNSKIRSSSDTIIESLSISTTDSPVSTSVKISTSSSTERINQKCKQAIQRAKTYFQAREDKKVKKISPRPKKKPKVHESTCTKEDHNNEKNPDNAEITETNATEEHIEKNEKINSNETKLPCSNALTPAKKYLRSRLGIDQRSINVKKENKDIFSLSKTHVYRISTKIKTFPSTIKESKKEVNQKENLKAETPQVNIQSFEKTAEPASLTPAKRYLRSKLGIDEKIITTKQPSAKKIQNPLEKDGKTETKTASRPESSSVKPSTKLNSIGPAKVRQPISSIRPISRNRESNFKKPSSANENLKREKRQSKFSKEKGVLSAKTNIVTNIDPGCRETNKISIELKKPVVLTSSMEELLAKALKIGLKKVNRSDLQDLQLKIKASVQSRNNLSGLEFSINSEKSDLASMQSMLESKISDFQTEMERRQRRTFDKIQELEDTIQARKKQLMDINKSKNMTLRKYEK